MDIAKTVQKYMAALKGRHPIKRSLILLRRKIFLLVLAALSFIFSSCARAPLRPPAVVPQKIVFPPSSPVAGIPSARQDIYHIVGPGETLWRISKMYDVAIREIMRINNLSKPRDLKMGQRLIVPQAAEIKSVITLYPSEKWKYIIIHHSATDTGNALSFYKSHRSRGWENVGYHFVIDNGTAGKQEGQIEVAPRWIKQQRGAHCSAAGMNYRAIGICLVGNFSKEAVSENQLNSLAQLVSTLRKYYNIPIKNILGHSQVPGARTECPGISFPWAKFKSRLE